MREPLFRPSRLIENLSRNKNVMLRTLGCGHFLPSGTLKHFFSATGTKSSHKTKMVGTFSDTQHTFQSSHGPLFSMGSAAMASSLTILHTGLMLNTCVPLLSLLNSVKRVKLEVIGLPLVCRPDRSGDAS